MSPGPNNSGDGSKLPKPGFMAKSNQRPGGAAGVPSIPGRPVKPRLLLQIKVPSDIEVVTSIVPVNTAHKFEEKLAGVIRQARIDLTTARTGSAIRDPGSMADDDTCCCVRG